MIFPFDLVFRMIALGMFSRVHRTYKEKDKKGKEKKDEQKSIKDEKSDEKTKEAKDSPKVKKVGNCLTSLDMFNY